MQNVGLNTKFLSNKANFCVVLFFEAKFLVLQAKLMKNVLTACLLTTPISGIHGNWVIEHNVYSLITNYMCTEGRLQ